MSNAQKKPGRFYKKTARFITDTIAKEVRQPNHTPDGLARTLCSAYERTDQLSLAELYRATTGKQARKNPLFEAGMAMANDMDQYTFVPHCWAPHNNNTFHNRLHFKKVLLNSFVLSQLAGLKGEDSLILMTSALIHDAYHDGTTNGFGDERQPFKLESKALEWATPYLRRAGVPDSVISKIEYMVLGTDIGSHSGDLDIVFPNGVDADTQEKAKMLWDADILASIGLTGEQAYQETIDLGKEWKSPILPKGYLKFLKFAVKGGFKSEAGKVFNGNIKPNRKFVVQRLLGVDPTRPGTRRQSGATRTPTLVGG